ncbi:MAG: hypothetical protein AAF479_10200 [Pseudomonadota bacterium]
MVQDCKDQFLNLLANDPSLVDQLDELSDRDHDGFVSGIRDMALAKGISLEVADVVEIMDAANTQLAAISDEDLDQAAAGAVSGFTPITGSSGVSNESALPTLPISRTSSGGSRNQSLILRGFALNSTNPRGNWNWNG